MSTRTRYRKGGLTSKVFATLMAIVLCVGFIPYVPALAYADSMVVGQTNDFQQSTVASVTGEDTIDTSGTYNLTAEKAGELLIKEGLDVTLIGSGTQADSPNPDVNVKCESNINLTIQDLKIAQSSSSQRSQYSVIDFTGGDNTLTIKGENLLEKNTGATNKAMVHVPNDTSLLVNGDGILYFFKSEQGAGFGGNGGEKNGVITFGDPSNGSPDLCIFGKGSKQGAVIGAGANASAGTPGDITFNSGTYTFIANARGALIGGAAGSAGASAGGKFVINGGSLNLNVDWTGAAIGGGGYAAGNDSSGGYVFINGGSIRSFVDLNAVPQWSGIESPGVTDKVITALKTNNALGTVDPSTGVDYTVSPLAVLPIDTSQLSTPATGSTSFTVTIDGSNYNVAGLHMYRYVNENLEQANQAQITETSDNWEFNTSDGTASGTPNDPNLYLYAAKHDANGNPATHEVVVNGDKFIATWDEATSAFLVNEYPTWYGDGTASAYTISSAKELAQFASIVNGTVPAVLGIAQDSFVGKTVTLANDIDLSTIEDWTPIGTSSAAFEGTLDGADHAISGLTIVAGEGGYKGLFGNNAGIAKDFTISGSITVISGNFVGAVAGFNSGVIEGVVGSVAISAENNCSYVGGIAGLSTSGLWEDGNATQQIEGAVGLITECSTSGVVTGFTQVGGIVGENAGTVSKCSSSAAVDGTQASKKNGVGGIAGRNGNSGTAVEIGTVDSCYFAGTVGRAGQKWTGGMAGFNNSLSSVTNCYMAGTLVEGGAGYNNAIVGNQEGSAANNYALSGYSNTGSSEAETGIIKNADEMKAAAFVPILNGEGSAFNVDSDAINGGYPVLAWQGGAAIASAEVADVFDAIASIPSDVTTEEGAAAVNDALAAYNALSDEQKALVPVSSVAALLNAQQAVAAAAQANLAAANNELAQAQNELASTNADLGAANAKVEAAEKARQSAAAEAAAAKAQVAQLKKDLSAASAAQGLKANPMTAKAKIVKAKAGKKKTVKRSKAFTVKGAKGKVTFYKVSGNAKIAVTKAGKVKVKAGLEAKKKAYKVKVLVVAAGDKEYASATKTVTLKVKVNK